MFGQAASSHTVWRDRSRISLPVAWYSGDTGALTRICAALRLIGLSGRPAFSGCRTVPGSLMSDVMGRGPSPDSDVDHPPEGVKHRLVHHLGQGRVREDGLHQLVLGGLELAGDHVALDQLGDHR